MCGINGFFGSDRQLVRAMNARLQHRGPDAAGVFVDEHISMGHTLLAIRGRILDSMQPVGKPGSPWVLAFNGQIYNTVEIKRLLGSACAGVELDTTLLAGLIERDGWSFVEKAHGMFAIALYHREEKILRLYRDHSGQKPLYYYHKGKDFAWSSEIKGLLAHGIDKTVDEEAVGLSAAYGYLPGEKTLFRYVKKILPGQVVSFDVKNGKVTAELFRQEAYRYPDQDEIFADVVREHLQSKREVAINLSGGLDSSLLLHEMSKFMREISTYTTAFEDSDAHHNEDALLAGKLAKDYGTRHTEIRINKHAYLENFAESLRLAEEPNYNISLPVYLLMAKRQGRHGDGLRVVLSGDGGDEVFGGYAHYPESLRMSRQQRFLTPMLFNRIKNRRNGTDFDFRRFEDRWLFFRGFGTSYARGSADTGGYARKTMSPYFDHYGRRGAVQPMMLIDRVFWQSSENFIRNDKFFMSQSMEVRAPLAHHPFRRQMDRILKDRTYVGETNKVFLRSHYAGKLPDYIVKRKKKTGWRSPVDRWYDKDLKGCFLDIIDDARQGGLVDWSSVRRAIAQSEQWPGKIIHLYLSLAVLSKTYDIEI